MELKSIFAIKLCSHRDLYIIGAFSILHIINTMVVGTIKHHHFAIVEWFKKWTVVWSIRQFCSSKCPKTCHCFWIDKPHCTFVYILSILTRKFRRKHWCDVVRDCSKALVSPWFDVNYIVSSVFPVQVLVTQHANTAKPLTFCPFWNRSDCILDHVSFIGDNRQF